MPLPLALRWYSGWSSSSSSSESIVRASEARPLPLPFAVASVEDDRLGFCELLVDPGFESVEGFSSRHIPSGSTITCSTEEEVALRMLSK